MTLELKRLHANKGDREKNSKREPSPFTFKENRPLLPAFTYVPVRIFLDTLRVGEITYGGLIPSHYFSVALLGLGIFLIVRGLKKCRHNIMV